MLGAELGRAGWSHMTHDWGKARFQHLGEVLLEETLQKFNPPPPFFNSPPEEHKSLEGNEREKLMVSDFTKTGRGALVETIRDPHLNFQETFFPLFLTKIPKSLIVS